MDLFINDVNLVLIFILKRVSYEVHRRNVSNQIHLYEEGSDLVITGLVVVICVVEVPDFIVAVS